jgi:hypothetical protein
MGNSNISSSLDQYQQTHRRFQLVCLKFIEFLIRYLLNYSF